MKIDPRGGHNRYKYNESFFTKWTPKMAYVLGFLYADGNITDSIPSRTQYTSFSSSEKEILKKIKSALDSKHKIYRRPPQFIRHKNGEYLSRESFSLRIGSRKMFNDLVTIGVVPNKSKIITFPNIPANYLYHFTRGYFDGDGCVYIEMAKGITKNRILRKLSIIFSCGSYKFLEGLKNRLSENNLDGFIYKSTRCFQLRYNTYQSVELFKLMYKDSDNLYLIRKFKTFTDYFKLRPQRVDKEILKIIGWRVGRAARQSSAKAFYSGANPLRALRYNGNTTKTKNAVYS